MHGMDVFVLKNGNTSAPDTRKKPSLLVRVKSHFFHKLLFGDIHVKPSDLESRNRKLSAHDCTGSYQNYFLPITTMKQSTKQPRNIAAMLLVPGHIFCATLLVMAAWKRSTRIDSSCCGGIIKGSFVSLLIKKYQQDKK